MNDLVVTVADMRRARICVRGARRWAKVNGVDFPDFLKNGIPASRLEAIGDVFCKRAVEAARQRQQKA